MRLSKRQRAHTQVRPNPDSSCRSTSHNDYGSTKCLTSNFNSDIFIIANPADAHDIAFGPKDTAVAHHPLLSTGAMTDNLQQLPQRSHAPSSTECDEIKSLVRDLPDSKQALVERMKFHLDRAPRDHGARLAYLGALSAKLDSNERGSLAKLILTGQTPTGRERD